MIRAMRETTLRTLRRLGVAVVLGATVLGADARDTPLGTVWLPSGRVIQAEVARTAAQISRGYMFREAISDNEGMVFLFRSTDFHSFWMKNCKVPLDIIWLDEDWRVVHLEENLPPCTKDPCPSWSPLRAARYVLEVRGGLAAREGVKTGAHVVFVPPDPVEDTAPSDGDSRH